MKLIGAILIGAGLSLLVYVGYRYIQDKNRVLSPLPEEKGVKVIFVTPSKQ